MQRKTYLVTGANSEVGAAICNLALWDGNTVIALYHSKNDRISSLDEGLGRKVLVQADFRERNSVEALIAHHKKMLSKVDVFISCAAVRNDVQYGEISTEDLIEHFSVNTIPHILLTQYLGPLMQRKKWGRIVICSSIGVKFGGGENSFCYSSSKLAGELIPKAAKEWSVSNVLVNVARVGVTETNSKIAIGEEQIKERAALIPMKRLAQPEEIAKSIYWLASDKNTYITGQIIPISGGE